MHALQVKGLNRGVHQDSNKVNFTLSVMALTDNAILGHEF